MLRPNGLLVVGVPNRFAWRTIKKDPHYNLPLISAFTPKLSKLVVDILKRVSNYDVGLFHSCSGFNKLLTRNGFRIVEGTHTWMKETRGYTRLKRWLRCNELESGFLVLARKEGVPLNMKNRNFYLFL